MSASSLSLAGLLLVAASSLTGCMVDAAPEAREDPSADVDGDLGEVQSAFGEASCATVSPNVEDGTLWDLVTTGKFYSATSGNYGQPGCTYGFIVDYTSGTNGTVNIWAGYHNQPTTAGACGMEKVRVQTYRSINGSWVPYELMTRHGLWHDGQCWSELDSGSPQASLGTGPTRVVAQAYSTFCIFGACTVTYQPIKLNAYVSL